MIFFCIFSFQKKNCFRQNYLRKYGWNSTYTQLQCTHGNDPMIRAVWINWHFPVCKPCPGLKTPQSQVILLSIYCSDTLFIMGCFTEYFTTRMIMSWWCQKVVNRYSGPHGGCQIARRTPVRWREKKIRTYLPLVHPQLLSCELGHHQQTQTKNLQPIMAIYRIHYWS